MSKLLLQKIKKIPKGYFSLNDIRKISGFNNAVLKVVLSRMVASKEIFKLTHGYYALDPASVDYEKFALEIYRPGYFSFEWALAYYNILSQQPYAYTLATTKRAKEINLKNIAIHYRHIQEKHFWGYQKTGGILIAEPEKALLDQAYLSLNGCAVFDIEEMDLRDLNKRKLRNYLRRFDNKKLSGLILKSV